MAAYAAQDVPASAVQAAPSENGRSEAALLALGESFRQVEGELKTMRERLKTKLPADEREKAEEVLKALDAKREALVSNLELVAAGIDQKNFSQSAADELNLQSETRDLLLPIVQELKQLIASPREIESLV